MVNKDQNEDILYIVATQKYLAHRKIKPQNLAKNQKLLSIQRGGGEMWAIMSRGDLNLNDTKQHWK